MLKVTLVRSLIKQTPSQVANIRALGLHKVGSSVVKDDSPVIKGMINKVSHLLKVEEVSGEETK